MNVFVPNPAAVTSVNHQRSFGAGRLSVKRFQNETRIDRLFQEGCAKIRLPKTCNNGLQAVMINSSGGITGGDRLEWEFDLQDQTSLTVTSQACERIYAATEDVGKNRISLTVGKAAKLAWLPQETILFDKGAFQRTIHVDLDEDADLLMVEPIVFGRKAMGESVAAGALKDSWRIRQGGRLIHAEETRFDGNVSEQLGSRAVADGHIAMASVLLVSPHAQSMLEPARTIIGPFGGASFWNGKFLARVITKDSYALRKILVPLIQLLNRGAQVPKVWAL